jgi:photosystem II stability/assembly factor-like uncharacterized protein
MKAHVMTMRRSVLAALFLATVMELHAQHWRVISRPTTRDLLRMSFADSTYGWVCGREGVLMRTTNGGRNWTAQTSGVATDIRAMCSFGRRHAWAITWIDFVDTTTFYGTGILRTTNGGTTWTSDLFPIRGEYYYAIRFLDSLSGFLCGERGLFQRTTDGGLTWIRASVDSGTFSQLPAYNVQFYSPSFGLGMGGLFDIAGGFWRTTDGGMSWSSYDGQGNNPAEPVFAVHFVDSLHIVAIGGDYEYGPTALRSRDGGITWTHNLLGIFGKPNALSFRTPTEGWVPHANNVMVTYDTSHTWVVPDTLGLRQISDLVFTDSLTGFAVSDSGYFFKWNRISTGIAQDVAATPTSIRLHQNFPNPFNPTTRISFTLSRTAFVSLKVFDLLGREVEHLVSDVQRPGEHHVVWDARNVASGIYVVRLSAGAQTHTKKMVLIR